MVAQDLPLHEPLASEVTTALIEFGQMSQHAGSAAFDALSTLASELLKRLVTLCAAQRGAMLLIGDLPDSLLKTSQASTIAEQTAPDQGLSHLGAKSVRTLALYAIREEEAYGLLTAFPAARFTSLDAQTASDMSCWITYRLSIGDIVAEQPLHALLVLGWNGLEDGTSVIALERCRALLPFVADAAAGVIVSILLAERVHELETAAEQHAMREADRLKTELLGTMNHELRNPLAAIKGYAATLLRHERRLSREERHEFLSAINQASDRLETIIEQLLEMSELETGEIVMQRAPVDMVHLAQEAIAAVEARAAEQLPGRFTFKLSVEQADGTPAHRVPLVSADLRRLREVLDNLLENAIIYSPGGGAIKVVLRPLTHLQAASAAGSYAGVIDLDKDRQEGQPIDHAAPNMVEICICDNGIGIPAEHLGRIFEHFHRVDTRLTREVNGLGLGLAICKRIIELHNGSIWAESSPGEGSKFHVLLPITNVGAEE